MCSARGRSQSAVKAYSVEEALSKIHPRLLMEIALRLGIECNSPKQVLVQDLAAKIKRKYYATSSKVRSSVAEPSQELIIDQNVLVRNSQHTGKKEDQNSLENWDQFDRELEIHSSRERSRVSFSRVGHVRFYRVGSRLSETFNREQWFRLDSHGRAPFSKQKGNWISRLIHYLAVITD